MKTCKCTFLIVYVEYLMFVLLSWNKTATVRFFLTFDIFCFVSRRIRFQLVFLLLSHWLSMYDVSMYTVCRIARFWLFLHFESRWKKIAQSSVFRLVQPHLVWSSTVYEIWNWNFAHFEKRHNFLFVNTFSNFLTCDKKHFSKTLNHFIHSFIRDNKCKFYSK